MKVANQLRTAYFAPSVAERTQPSKLQADLTPGLVASVQVYFYNRHFIGHRHLQLNFKTLTKGLQAWEVMQAAKGVAMFTGNGVTDAYSPEAASQQWQRIKEAYLCFASGRRSTRAEIEEQLTSWEKQQLPIRLQRECKLWRQKQKLEASKPLLNNEPSDVALTRSLDSLLRQEPDPSLCSSKPLVKPVVVRLLCGRKRRHDELIH